LRSSAILILSAALLAASCSGCQQKFTRQRYETVCITMPDRQVRDILGKPKVEPDGSWSYVRGKPYRKAVIRFDQDGRVTDKSWSNERPPTIGP
jgi:hypothetical protein